MDLNLVKTLLLPVQCVLVTQLVLQDVAMQIILRCLNRYQEACVC